ncbi:MAG: peptide deformylase [Gammaproteobacteria bacterium]|nr:peptide deformylase [Gammaproteobacteria bacterium]MYF28763.1 peptide deformylase [Gammaproteobacteria bacterium]MYK47710.1 peptide deformylase [Gammaproteobacteria bacterium]
MARLPVLHYPDPRLRTKAKPVDVVGDDIRQLIDDLLETMYEAPGIGLAATQVNVHKRVLVVDVSENRDEPRAFVNPVIEFAEGTQEREEGCLSVPGFFEPVERSERIRVAALDREGKPFTLKAEGLLAVCIQHECDHLDGKLFVDYLSSLKRQRIKKKLQKRPSDSGRRPAVARAGRG